MTVKDGDPSWAGALAGVALGLPTFHITEAVIKDQISAEDYEEHVALMEAAMESGEIQQAVKSVRESKG